MDVPSPARDQSTLTEPEEERTVSQMGPPKVPPNWSSILKGAPSRPPESELQTADLLVRHACPDCCTSSGHCRCGTRMPNHGSVRSALGDQLTTIPAARPYSAENWFVISRNS